MSDRENYFMKLQTVLHHFSIVQMTQEEINYLQLHYMEHLQHDEIATLLETDTATVTALEEKFATIHSPGL